MFNWFNLLLALIVGTIIVFIVKTVKQTQSEINKNYKGKYPAEDSIEQAKQLAEQIRGQDVKCQRCGRQTFMMLGTNNKYKCYDCNFEFEGPEHGSNKSE